MSAKPRSIKIRNGKITNSERIRELLLKGYSVSEVSSKLGCSRQEVYYQSRKHDLPRNPEITIPIVLRVLALKAVGVSDIGILRDTGLPLHTIKRISEEMRFQTDLAGRNKKRVRGTPPSLHKNHPKISA